VLQTSSSQYQGRGHPWSSSIRLDLSHWAKCSM
jgi:hypothetical protein